MQAPALPTGLRTSRSETNINRPADFSVNMHGPVSVMNNEELIRDLDRWQSKQAMGYMAALP